MIKTKDAIRVARSLIGTPYSELDCINLVKKVIRTAPGGVKGYTTAGTNTLWDSIDSAQKYRDLTERHEGLIGIPAGALPFKRYGVDGEDHVGIATGEGTVIHSSSVNGMGVVETPLTTSEGWDCWGVHRYIEVAEGAAESEDTPVTAYKMQVSLNNPEDPDNYLSVRKGPGTGYDIIGRLGHGSVVTVQSEVGKWAFITYGDSGSGYVSANYLTPYEESNNIIKISSDVTIIDSEGNRFKPVGDWRVLIGSVD